MRILVIELQQAVHSIGYIKSLTGELEHHASLSMDIAIAQSHAYLGDLTKEIEHTGNVPIHRFREIFKRGNARIRNWGNALAALFQLRKTVRDIRPDLVIFLRIDFVFPWLASGILQALMPGCRFSGIYFGGEEFRPRTTRALIRSVQRSFERALVTCVIRRPELQKLLLLDHSLVSKLRDAFPLSANRIAPSADPWQPFEKCSKSEARGKLGLPRKGPMILSLGVQSARKGTVELIDGFKKARIPSDSFLVIAGPVRPEVDTVIKDSIQGSCLGGRIYLENRFIKDQETWLFLQAADLIACPYRDFLQSSNVMIRACATERPVLVSKGGVMGDAVAKFGCGISVDPTPDELASGLSLLIKEIADAPGRLEDGCRAYAKMHTSSAFFQQFL